jgi:carbon monoxide dehydrogenase subunit G
MRRAKSVSGLGAAVALVAAALLLAAAPGAAEDQTVTTDAPASAASSSRPPVDVTVSRGPAGLEIDGRCLVQGTGADAWRVLTDYDGISRFVSSMRESHVSSRGPGYLIVDQVAVGRLLLFSKRMHASLRVVEEPPARITFEDVLRRDFQVYQGEWRVEPQAAGTAIVYHVTAQPTFSIPDAIARGMFRKTVRELLSQVAAEIDRRAHLAPVDTCEQAPAAVNHGAEGEP